MYIYWWRHSEIGPSDERAHCCRQPYFSYTDDDYSSNLLRSLTRIVIVNDRAVTLSLPSEYDLGIVT